MFISVSLRSISARAASLSPRLHASSSAAPAAALSSCSGTSAAEAAMSASAICDAARSRCSSSMESKVVGQWGLRDAHRDTGINTCVAVGPIFSLSMESCRVFCSCCFDEHRAASTGRAGHAPPCASSVSRGAADFARFLAPRRRTRRSARTAQHVATRERRAAHELLRPSGHSSAHLLHDGEVPTAPSSRTVQRAVPSETMRPVVAAASGLCCLRSRCSTSVRTLCTAPPSLVRRDDARGPECTRVATGCICAAERLRRAPRCQARLRPLHGPSHVQRGVAPSHWLLPRPSAHRRADRPASRPA